MAGEMYAINPVTGTEPDGTVWNLHAAIAKAVGGTIHPFDQYQGPYVVVGPDMRIGRAPYALAVQHRGIVRLWIGSDDGMAATVYREDTDILSEPFLVGDEIGAVNAALSLLS